MHGKAALVVVRKEKEKINPRPVRTFLQREHREDDVIVLRVSSAWLETVQTLENTKNHRAPRRDKHPIP